MHYITVKDFPGLDFGDIRRNDRFVSIINNINQQPGSSIPKQNTGWYNTKATYLFFRNEAVSFSSLQQAIAGFGCRQAEGLQRILVAHDMANSYFEVLGHLRIFLQNPEGV